MRNLLRAASPEMARLRVIYFIAFIVVIGCDPVKKVMDSESKTQQVVNKYLQTHPARIDTVNKFIPGKTDTLAPTILNISQDTVMSHDTVYITKTNTAYRTINRVDTVVKTIVDNKLLQACQDNNASMGYGLKDAQLKQKAAELDAKAWKMRCIGVVVGMALVVVIAWLINKLFSKIN